MSTDLTTIQTDSFYGRIVDPLAFISEMGKALAMAGVCGCTKPADGQVIAWACVAKKTDPFTIAQQYHFMGGKLVKKAEAMLADFRSKAKGKHKWLTESDNLDRAELQLTDAEGNVVIVSFTMARAVQAGYVKAGSNWVKRPEQQLRSRCITDGVRMIAPEIAGGDYTEDEIEDVISDQQPVVRQTRTKAEVAKRAAELRGEVLPTTSCVNTPEQVAASVQNAKDQGFIQGVAAKTDTETVALKPVADTTVIDAEYTVSPTVASAAPVVSSVAETSGPTAEDQKVQAELMELAWQISVGLRVAEWTDEAVLPVFNKKFGGTNYESISEFPVETQRKIKDNIIDVLRSAGQLEAFNVAVADKPPFQV